MALNSSNRAHVDRRRRWVARLRLRGMTQREIVDRLPRIAEEGFPPGVLNPRTNAPYALCTINRDLKAIAERWREQANLDIATLTARHLAELWEVRRAAWAKGDVAGVLRALQQEAKLLGLDAPSRGMMLVAGVDGVPSAGGLLLRERIAGLPSVERTRVWTMILRVEEWLVSGSTDVDAGDTDRRRQEIISGESRLVNHESDKLRGVGR